MLAPVVSAVPVLAPVEAPVLAPVEAPVLAPVVPAGSHSKTVELQVEHEVLPPPPFIPSVPKAANVLFGGIFTVTKFPHVWLMSILSGLEMFPNAPHRPNDPKSCSAVQFVTFTSDWFTQGGRSITKKETSHPTTSNVYVMQRSPVASANISVPFKQPSPHMQVLLAGLPWHLKNGTLASTVAPPKTKGRTHTRKIAHRCSDVRAMITFASEKPSLEAAFH